MRRTETEEHEDLFIELRDAIKELKQVKSAIEAKLGKKEKDQHAKAKKFVDDYDYWKLKVDVRLVIANIAAKERALSDRKNHYENVYLPKFDKDSTECNKELAGVENKCKEILKKRNLNPMFVHAIKKAIKDFPEEYKKEKEKNRKQALKNTYYKSLLSQVQNYQASQKKKR